MSITQNVKQRGDSVDTKVLETGGNLYDTRLPSR